MEYPESLVTFFCTTTLESVNKTSDSCVDENAHENPRSIHYNFVSKILLLYYLMHKEHKSCGGDIGLG